jgi:hypothetical protein
LTHLDEERTHKVSVDLDDNSGTIDLFVTITGTTPSQEASNDGESANNAVLDVIPSKFTDEDLQRYVSRQMFCSSLVSSHNSLLIRISCRPFEHYNQYLMSVKWRSKVKMNVDQ